LIYCWFSRIKFRRITC